MADQLGSAVLTITTDDQTNKGIASARQNIERFATSANQAFAKVTTPTGLNEKIKALEGALKNAGAGTERFDRIQGRIDDLKARLASLGGAAAASGRALDQAFSKGGRPLQTAANGVQYFVDAQGKLRDASGRALTAIERQAMGLDKLAASAKRAGAATQAGIGGGSFSRVNTISGLSEKIRSLEGALGNVAIGSDRFGRIQGRIDELKGRLGDLGGTADTTAARFAGMAARVAAFAGGAGAVIGFARSVSQVGIAAESAEVRLKALTGRFGDTEAAQGIVANAAKTLNLSFTEAASSFAQLYGSLRPTGVALKDIETLFVGVSAAAKNLGLSSDSVNLAMIQLTQGLASGRLQGDELRSVLEQLPPLAQAIAQEMNTTVGALKQLGADGKITTDVILKAASSMKDVELGGLQSSLNTTAERLKTLRIEWEKIQVGLAKEVGPLFTGGLVGLLKAFSEINLSPADRKIRDLEAQITEVSNLIARGKEFNVDTRNAEERLRALQNQFNDAPKITSDSNAIYEERLRLVEAINKQEREGLFGLTFGRNSTGIIQGTRDFSGNALLEGFDQAAIKAANKFNELQERIKELQREKIALPLEARAQRDQIEKEIKRIEDIIRNGTFTLKIETQLQVSQSALAELNKQIGNDPGNQALKSERDQLVVQIADLQRQLANASKGTGADKALLDKAAQTKKVLDDITKASRERLSDAKQLVGLEGLALTAAKNRLDIEKLRKLDKDASNALNTALKANNGDTNTRAIIDAAGKLEIAGNNLSIAMVEGSEALRKASEDAAKRFVSASETLVSAQLRLSEIQGNSDQGLNKYLNPSQQDQRIQTALTSLGPAFGQALKDAQKILTSQGIELSPMAFDDLKSIMSRAGAGMSISGDDLRRVQEFIQRAQTERNSIRDVNTAQSEVNAINKELASVSAELRDQVAALATKEWGVQVNVSGTSASVYGDVVNRVIS